jgi:hypothetical protein
MFLVGELDNREWFKGMGQVKVKAKYTKEDLIKAKGDRSFQVINLDTLQFFDPDKNDFIDFDKE